MDASSAYSDESELTSDRIFGYVLSCVPSWQRAVESLSPTPVSELISIRRLTGGYSNTIFALTWKGPNPPSAGDSYRRGHVPAASEEELFPECLVARVFGKAASILVNRALEVDIATSFSKAGRAPFVYGAFKGGYVTSFVHGQALDCTTCLSHCEALGREMARWHRVGQEFHSSEHVPMLWEQLDKWCGFVEKYNSESASLCRTEKEILKKRLDEGCKLSHILPSMLLCHNDVNPTNVMLDSVTQEPLFIDLEYSFRNCPLFDIAHHFVEYGGMELNPDLAVKREWRVSFLRAYLQEWRHVKDGSKDDEHLQEDIDALIHDAEMWLMAVHFMWGVWALVTHYVNLTLRDEKDRNSDDYFDFEDYSRLRFFRYCQQVDKMGFGSSELSKIAKH